MGQGRVAAKIAVGVGLTGVRIMRWLALIATMADLLLSPLVPASAQEAKGTFPHRPIHIVTPIAPGGNMDLSVRVFAEKLAAILGQPVIVENRPGAGSLIGIQAVLSAPADGYTLLAMSNSFHLAPLLMKNRPFDPMKDFAGIGFINSVPMALTVGSSKPDRTAQDLIARAKANPGTVSYASGGVASSTHVPAALFALEAGLDLIHVPYKGNAPAMGDLIAGRIDFAFNTITSSIAYLNQGHLRALAVSTKSRSDSLPNIPTLAESGLPNYDQSLYTGLVVLAGTPRDIVQRLHQTLHEASVSPEVVASIRRSGGDVIATQSQEEFDAFLAREGARYDRLIKQTGLKLE
jgi:tripartite-type tricarboxylate transporter receptor subunit TctC